MGFFVGILIGVVLGVIFSDELLGFFARMLGR